MSYATQESVTLTRDVEAAVVPVGTKVTLLKGEVAHIAQSLGGAYTVVVNGNMFRIGGQDADALGLQVEQKTASASHTPRILEDVEKESWTQMKSCYDPEIPVNIVDLGLIYDCHVEALAGGSHGPLQGGRKDDAHRARLRHGPGPPAGCFEPAADDRGSG